MKVLLVSVSYNSSKINISWSEESNVDNYEINILGANGEVIHTQKTDSEIVSLELLIEDYQFKVGGIYFVVVRYSANNVLSSWSDPVELILNNPALPVNIITCEAGTVMTSVSDPDKDASVYTFQIQEENDSSQDNSLILAESVVTPKGLPLALTSQVEVGKKYQIRSQLWLQNSITEWTDYSEITIIDVAKPELKVTYQDKTIHCSWDEIPGANGYELECWSTGSTPEQILRKTITTNPCEIDITDGFEEDQVYDIRLRAYQEACYSKWDEKEVYTSSLSPVLKDLYDRLLSAYSETGNKSLKLDSTTLGNSGKDIVDLFDKELNTECIELNNPITISPDPEKDQILISGVCMNSLLGIEASTLEITFTTEATKTNILICLSIPTGNDWSFTTTFPELSSTYIDSFTFDTSDEKLPAFVLCSTDQPEDSLYEGLNFRGAINVTGALSVLSDLITEVGTSVLITGTIVRKDTLLTILLKGNVPDISLDFTGFQKLSFIKPAFVFYVRQDIVNSYISLMRWVESDVTLSGVGIPLAVKLPDAVTGWSVMLTPGKTVPLGNIPGFLGFLVNLDLSELLPKAIEALDKFNLTGFQLAFDKDQTTFKSLSLEFDTAPSSTPLWTILPCLSFNKLTLQLQVYPKENSGLTYNADILGVLNLTDALALQTRIILPIGSGEWVFSCYSTEAIDSLAAISSLMNGADLGDYLPQELGAIGQFELSGLTITYDPGENKLTCLGINVESAAPWVLIKDQLIIQRICVNLKMKNPFDKTRELTGMIQGCLLIGQGDIEATIVKYTSTTPWLFMTELLPGTMISINDLATVGGTNEENIDSFLPSTLPILNLLALTQFYLEYDISNIKLNNTSFTISLNEPWEAIKNYVVLDTAEVSMEINSNIQNDVELMASISARILLGDNGSGIVFDAKKKTENANWCFSGIMIGSLEVNFNDLLNKINLNEKFIIPDESWLPTITFTELNANMTPEESLFHVDGIADIEWTIPFVDIEFPMKSLGGSVDISKKEQQEEDSNDKMFSALIFGKFEFASINTTLTLELKNNSDTIIFTAELTNSEVSEVDVPALTDGFSDGSEDTKWSNITPNDITDLSFNSAFLYYNQKKGDYLVYGGINNFGDALFYSKNIGTDTAPSKGYIFSFALSEGFKFSNLFTALAPIDEILIIRNAGIAIVSYEVDSANELVEEINQIINEGCTPGVVTNPIKQGNLPEGTVNKGVHLYSGLQFTGPLFSVFNQLISSGTSGLDVTLYAFFTTDSEPEKGSTKTIFRATFEPFDLINGLISFKGVDDSSGIAMEFIQTDSTQFNLSGTIGFNVFEKNYEFIGNLTVDNDQTHFSVTTAPETSVTIQLFPESMPPLMVLKQLGLDVIYYFKTEERSEKYLELNVSGKVELLDTIFLDSNLFLLDGKPILAQICLTQDFAISQLIGNLVGNDQPWPTDFFDITFIADKPDQHSRLYYYDSSVDTNPSKVNVNGNDYKVGYNLESAIDLTFLYTLRILLKINIETNNGMSAEVGLGEAINIFILELASFDKSTTGNKKYINGPKLNLNTKNDTTVFGFSTGFNFFEYPFGKADITIGSKELAGGKSETKIGAKLTADEAVPIFGNLSVDFTYCRSEGFKVNNWPDFTQIYESIDKVIDIADEVSGIMKKADPSLICGEIVDLIADVTYENKINISPSFSTEGNETDGYSLYFVLNGTFEVYVFDQKVSGIEFPDSLKIPLPNGTSFDDLGGYIKDAIKASAESFIEGLINNGEQWAQVAAILFAEQAAELGAKMLCEGLIDAVVAEAMVAGADALITAGGVAAGAAAVVAGVAAAGKAVSSCFTAGTEILMADDTVKPIEDVQIGDKLYGYNNSLNIVLAYDRPKLGPRKLYSINNGPYFFTSEHPFLTDSGWKAVDPEKTKSENPELPVARLYIGDQLLTSDGKKITLEDIKEKTADSDTQLYNFKLSGNNTYIANKLIAHNKGGGDKPEDDKPNPPKIKYVEYNADNLAIATEWEKAEYANGYNYELHKPDGSKLDQKTLCYTESSISTSIKDENLPSGEYKVKVCSTRNDYSSKWSEKNIQKLGTTSNIVLSYDENSDRLLVNWDAIESPKGYSLKLIQDDKLLSQLSVDDNKYGCDANSLPAGLIKAEVSAAGDKDNIPGDFVSSDNSIEKPAPPLDIQISNDNGNIKVIWQDDSWKNGYLIILQKDGADYSNKQTSGNYVDFDAETFEKGVYTAKVRKQGDSTILPGSFGISQSSVEKLEEPVIVDFNYDSGSESLKVVWNNVLNNNGYKLLVTDSENQQNIAWEGTVGKDINNNTISVTELGCMYAAYSVSIKTLGNNQLLESKYAVSTNEIKRIGEPVKSNISYNKDNNTLECSWDSVEGALSYDIEIEKQTENVTSIVFQANKTETKNISIKTSEISDFTAATYYLKVRAKGTSEEIPGEYKKSDDYVVKLNNITPSASFNDNFITIDWILDKNADNYIILLQNQSSKDEHKIYVTNTPAEIIASDYSSGEYNLTMQAISENENIVDGDTSEPVSLSITPLNINQLASKLKDSGEDVLQTSQKIHKAFPEVSYTDFTVALAQAGYSQQETIEGLKQEFPDLTPEEVTEAINAAFKKQSASEYAKEAKDEGKPVEETAVGLVKNYPQLNATDFAVALAQGGYSQTDVATALKQEFPDLTPQEFVDAINAAFK